MHLCNWFQQHSPKKPTWLLVACSCSFICEPCQLHCLGNLFDFFCRQGFSAMSWLEWTLATAAQGASLQALDWKDRRWPSQKNVKVLGKQELLRSILWFLGCQHWIPCRFFIPQRKECCPRKPPWHMLNGTWNPASRGAFHEAISGGFFQTRLDWTWKCGVK